MPEKSRREEERELLREVEQAQEEYHSGPPQRRTAAFKKYVETVNRFSQFVLANQPRDEK